VNADFAPLPWPDNFADWLERRSEPASLKAIAYSAIDAFRNIHSGTITRDSSLETLYFAACHPRFVIWEVALPLLAKLSEADKSAREKIVALSHEGKAELRRRSIQYMNDRYPRSYCVSILSRLLTDRSAKVKDVVAGRISSLNLTELLPAIEHALAEEKDAKAQWCYNHVLSLMRDGYHYDIRDKDATLWLYYPEQYPARSPYIREAQLRFENGEDISKIKTDTLRQHPHMLLGRRDWEWGDEPSNAPESRSRAF
jgi:predicted transcriptional regulator with HTH domain